MRGHQKFLRYQWFDREVRAGKYPNARKLAEQFEIDPKTADRTITFMRDSLCAPLEYDSSRRGYYYSDATFQLPAVAATQEELLAILLAQNLLSDSADGVISKQIRTFGLKLYATTGQLGLSQERINEAFSASWNEFAPAKGAVFQLVLQALIENRLLEFIYTSPRDQTPTKRSVEPHHLQHYMGSWGMIGFCHLRKEWRKFMLSRITAVKLLSSGFTPKPREEWLNQLEGGFGIFQGKEPKRVALKFNAFRAPWIREQIWHQHQELQEEADGGVTLIFPASHFHEVKMKVLQFGADVEVLEPTELRDEVRDEIKKMNGLYV